MLTGENVSNTINLNEIAEQTEGFSCSDLRETCRNAVIHQVHSHLEKKKMRPSSQQKTSSQCDQSHVEVERLQPVSQEDLLFGLSKLKASKRATSSAVPNATKP
ncbi:ATPase family AAA domain-containing protein 1-A-like [Thalassophryne amazonica]|uniref:ATPase family AAA domain-containing protein 1-A-like n=1 Tax=Thalassophryne amazonica TaxID=390379 RepID=UPI001470EF5F|nr:ATPase family AAA domain-containing protein 1-A-like [Thalassophryne amazonica]